MKALVAVPSTAQIVAGLVIGVTAFRYGHDLVKLVLGAPTIDFATHYGYTRALAHGVDPFGPDGRHWMDAWLGVRRAGTPPTFPPGGYVVFLPFVALPYAAARAAWLALGQLWLVVSVVLLHRRLATDAMLALCGLFVVLSYQPIFEDVALGNVNLTALVLLTVAMLAHADGRPVATALALSAAIVLKLPYVALIPLVLWLGSPGTALLALGVVIGWCGLAVLIFGTGWITGYWTFLSVGSAPLHAWPRNLSPHAVLHRVTGVDGPDVWIDAIAIAVAVAIVAAVALVTRDAGVRAAAGSTGEASPREVRDAEGRLGAWALALAVLPLATPLAEENQLVVQLIPVLYALARASRLRTHGERLALLVAILLIASRYSLEDFTMFSHGILALAQTGKIVGLALLAALIARLVGRRAHAA